MEGFDSTKGGFNGTILPKGSGGKVVDTTYADLVALRDGGELVPGTAYRITDYACTTTQNYTSSAGIGFDIIVKAVTASTLDENAKAAQRAGVSITQVGVEVVKNQNTFNNVLLHAKRLLERDTSKDIEGYYAFSSGLERYSGGLKLEYIDLTILCSHEIPEDGDVVYGLNPLTGEAQSLEGVLSFYTRDFFEDIDKWELKYCLDNDTNRFAWADTENGKGVVFGMTDEFGNESYYDFVNIRFAFDRVSGKPLSDLGTRATFAPGCRNNKVTDRRTYFDSSGSPIYDTNGKVAGGGAKEIANEVSGLRLPFVALGFYCDRNIIVDSSKIYIGTCSSRNLIDHCADSFADCSSFRGNTFADSQFIFAAEEDFPLPTGDKVYFTGFSVNCCKSVNSYVKVTGTYSFTTTSFTNCNFTLTRQEFTPSMHVVFKDFEQCTFNMFTTPKETKIPAEPVGLTFVSKEDGEGALRYWYGKTTDLVDEAPQDGKQYIRKDGEWEEYTNPSDILIDAPEIMLAGGTLSWAMMSTCGLSHEQYNALPDGAIVTVKLRADASSNVENFPMAITKIDAQGNGKAAASALCLGQNSSYVMVLFRMTITASGVECEYTTKTIN